MCMLSVYSLIILGKTPSDEAAVCKTCRGKQYCSLYEEKKHQYFLLFI